MEKKATKTTRNSGSGAYRVVGKTSDGVTILKPKTKPTHFTLGEIRTTIKQVRKEAKSSKFVISGRIGKG